MDTTGVLAWSYQVILTLVRRDVSRLLYFMIAVHNKRLNL